jgi:hypothetical protein
MIAGKSELSMISNIDVYFAIASEAVAEAERLENAARRPKPDGEPGFIITYDPEQKSFKASLIAIVFAGMYLEALFYLNGTKRFGRGKYNKKLDKMLSYEEKLELFGITDQTILAEARHFRKMRRGLVHEKALKADGLTVGKIRVAQDEARKALSFVRRVGGTLRYVT